MGQTHDGGKPEKKDLPYSPPVGPKGQDSKGPGLPDNCGPGGTQGRH